MCPSPALNVKSRSIPPSFRQTWVVVRVVFGGIDGCHWGSAYEPRHVGLVFFFF